MKSLQTLIISAILLVSFSCAKSTVDGREYQIGAYLWFQTSGEYRALCHQAYNLARLKLDRDLEEKHNGKRAVVFDIDETVLDNSFSGAYEIKNNIPWDQESFDRWVALKKAELVPGAKEFIDYAISKRVEVIFISNRKESQKEDTLENFKRVGLTAKKENLYEVLKKYHVALYFGDNLGDFAKDWDSKTSESRRALVDARKEDFGDKFIVLPNPLYGDWEKSLPKFNMKSDLLKTIP